jgi:hypothetical protein
MPDLAPLLTRLGVHSGAGDARRCSRCRRTPLVGELMHTFESGRSLCELCAARLPEADRTPVRSERVHASHRRLAVVSAA